jgi:hydrogenase maturation protease
MSENKTDIVLLIGLGNPILGDDGVGWRVLESVESKLQNTSLTNGIEFEYLSLGGLALMERMEGYRDVILIDSILTGENPLGTIYSLPLSRLPNFSSGHSTAVHDTSLQTALELGRKMGLELPDDIWVVAVEAEQVFVFSDQLSKPIKRAVPKTVELVLEILEKGIRVEREIPLKI